MTTRRMDRCRKCHHRILWVHVYSSTSAKPKGRGNWMPVNATPVDPGSHQAANAWVVVGERVAYPRRDLAEILMTSRNIALEDAHDAVRTDFPWHLSHACPNPAASEESTDGTS